VDGGIKEVEMSLVVEAVYEDGVLKPDQPLPIKEHERVQITIHPAADPVKETGLSDERLSALAAKYPPPPEWFDEDWVPS
jgi:predicted DNA-binding antitoxin AbrB/MazE fold protein